MNRDENSPAFLRWKINRLNEGIQASNEFLKETTESYEVKIESLENQIKVLKEELQVSKHFTDELKDQLKSCHMKYNLLENDGTQFQNESQIKQAKLAKKVSHLEETLKTNKEVYLKTLQEQVAQEKQTKSRLIKECDEKVKEEKKIRSQELRMQENRMQKIIDNRDLKVADLNRRLAEIELDNKKTLKGLEKKMDLKVKEIQDLQRQLEAKQREVKKLKESFEERTQDLHTEIAKLKWNAECQAQTIKNMDKNIQEEKVTVKAREQKILEVTRNRDKAWEKLSKINYVVALHTASLKIQEEDIKKLNTENEELVESFKEKKKELELSKRLNALKDEEIQRHRLHKRAMEPQRINMRNEVSKYKTLLLRVREDIQSCMSDVENPVKLRQRVFDLQNHVSEEDDETAEYRGKCRKAVDYHKEMHQKAIEYCRNISVSQSRERFHLGEQLHESHMNLSSVRDYYIQLLNEKIVTESKLRQEIKDLKEEFEKATKPASKVGCCVNKSDLKSTPSAIDEEVEEPVLHPDAWVSFVPPDVTPPSPLVNRSTGVKPVQRVVERLPPADI